MFYVVHSPTNALFINLVKSFKFMLKYTIISLLHVSVFNDHHQGALSVPNCSYIYVKTLGKITSLCIFGDVAACRRAACVLCAVQSETAACVLCAVQSETFEYKLQTLLLEPGSFALAAGKT